MSSRLYTAISLFFLTLLSANLIVRASEDEARSEEYDVQARVVRISLITGEVTLKRKTNTDWEQARLNFPLVEGDTLVTDRESRLEIQFDSRNFVRLGPNTTMQIVTLRDEGVALSIAEGTASIRLARFDRQREYFEVDAPRSTIAAEKVGLYRIDVPREGRLRFSVRGGGSARIYSDTSGFVLRDGRTAELIVIGDNAGDWEFVAEAAPDAMDQWVSDRERYLAQRLRYDVQYYDEYVWGAEDLDAYGDWAYTTDYGWIWTPHSTVINIYSDWAPYRYGHWVWCPPYGWIWVGYEPWGWAPYHYGRWVFHSGYWAWCPRSAFFHDRSWWRPALVAFVNFNGTYCWYPLGYHQHDPGARNYPSPARLTPLRASELAKLQRVNPVQLRAVTSANAKQLGGEDLKPTRADTALARQALLVEPLRTGLPARSSSLDSATRNDASVARPPRTGPAVPAATATGATERTPGASLDDELRRSRVLNGREARPETSPSDVTTSGIETRPTGAVTRPVRPPRETLESNDNNRENSGSSPAEVAQPERRQVATPANTNSEESRPTRNEAPANSAGEKPMRGRERIESARPERRSETPVTTYESSPRSATPARVETPSRNEAPSPRAVTPPARSEPAPRSESPRSEPRSEPPSKPSRPDNYEPLSRPSRSEPTRTEAPRSEPRRTEAPRSEPSRTEAPRSEPRRTEAPRSEPTRTEAPRSEPSRTEAPRSEPTRTESPRSSEAPPKKPGDPLR